MMSKDTAANAPFQANHTHDYGGIEAGVSQFGTACKIASTSAPDSRQLRQVNRINFGS
jgi:hypothetical protein